MNLASRMESMTNQYGCSILITERTKEMLTNDLITREIDEINIKGFDIKKTIYSLEMN